MKKRVIVYSLFGVLTFLQSYSLFAQKCTSLEKPLRDEFDQLVTRIQNNQEPEIRTIDDFLARLPATLRQDYIFMAKSRSLQEGTVESPRIILKSPNAEVVLSFTPSPGNRGGNAIEIMRFNPEEGKYLMTEIAFNERAGTQRVSHNPSKCLECHHNPPRPIWDPYRFWSGQVPFHEDTIPSGSVEAGWYRDYLKKITDGESRWRHLTPRATPENFDRAVQVTDFSASATQAARNVFSGADGNASNLSNQYLRQNACKVMNEVAERDDFNQIKYALAGALKGCSNVNEFLPEVYQFNAEDYFLRHNMGIKDNRFDYNELHRDTVFRLENSTEDKLNAQRWFFKEQGLTDQQIEAEISMRNNIGFGLRNFETSAPNISALRYLMLPLGVNVNTWSMAIDPMSFGHGEIFNEYSRQQVIAGEINKSCEELARLSNAALLETVNRIQLQPRDYACKFNRVGLLSPVESLISPVNMIQDQRAGEILNVCAACHNNSNHQTPFNNVPYMPFNDIERMKQFLKDRPGLDRRIMDRVSRQRGEPGSMPKNMPSLNEDQVLELRDWFESLRNRP